MINKLDNINLNCGVFSVYDFNSMSQTELLCKFFEKINDVITDVNTLNDLVKWLTNQGLEQEISAQLAIWLADGTIAKIINEDIFNDLNNKLNLNIQKTDQIETDLNTAKTDLLSKIVKNSNKIDYVEQIILTDYGYTSDSEYINTAIDNAIAANTDNKIYEIILPNGTHSTNKTITLDRRYTLVGNNTTLLCDYNHWVGSNTNCIEFKIATQANTPDDVIDKFNKRFENITINSIGSTNKNNTTGIKIYSEGLTGQAVNRALNNCRFKNVMIRNFEYGLVINECYGSNFTGLDIIQTRVGILIEGQSVNLSFSGLNISNHSRLYSNTTTQSLIIKANRLNEIPEGLMFTNCLFFGSDYGIDLVNGYFATFTNCIIDWCSVAGVRESAFRNYNISNSYIAVYPSPNFESSCILSNHVFDTSNTLTSSPCSARITNCSFYGGNLGGRSYGINYGTDNTHIVGFTMNVENCDFDSFDYMIFSSKIAPANSTFKNLRGLNIRQFGVNVQGGLWDCRFEDISINSDIPFIDLRANFISSKVTFGKCITGSYATYFEGSATISSGQTELNLPNGLFKSELGMDCITTILNQYSIPSFKIIEEVNWSDAKIVFTSPVDKDYKIRYSARVVKSTL